MRIWLLSVWLLTVPVVVQAETRIMLMFDISHSMSAPVRHVCDGKKCYHPKALVQLHIAAQAWEGLADTLVSPCHAFFVQVSLWNNKVFYTSDWIEGTSATQRKLVAEHLSQIQFIAHGYTELRKAFDSGLSQLQRFPLDAGAIIIITDGDSSDAWSEAEGHAIAERAGYLFRQHTIDTQASTNQLETDLQHTLITIYDQLHGCFG